MTQRKCEDVLEWQGGKLESDDCDATGPKPIWTSTCVFDDQGRSKAWCNAWLQWLCRFAHIETCRVRLEKALADERADPVETPVGPITEPATESQESAPAAQQEPASSTTGPAVPMPAQSSQNEQPDSPMEMGAQERRSRQGARPSETPTSEISERPVVKARPASPPTIVPTAEGSGTIALCAAASSSKDEMTIGGLYVIDGIDVVANLVPEEDVWQFEATETCIPETQMQDGEQESIAVVHYEDPSTSETSENSIQKRCERDEPKRCESSVNLKSKWRSTNQRCK